MIVFVTLSPKRFLVLDVPPFPTGWYATFGSTDMGKGYRCVQATRRIAGPCSWLQATQAASEYATRTGQLITPEQWQQEARARMDALINSSVTKEKS